MAKFKFWRASRRRKLRKSRTAPLLPEFGGMAVSARRVNRLVAAVTVFGACGTVALAVALTPGAQTSASGASAAQGALEISRIETQPVRIQKVSLPATVTAALPQPALQAAPKSDRLVLAPVAPQPAAIDRSPYASVRGPLGEESAKGIAAAPDMGFASRTVYGPEAEFEPEQERGVELALSQPRSPGEPSVEAASGPLVEEIEEAIEEAAEDAVEEPVDDPAPEVAEEPAPEPVAVARTAPVRSDVNLRAGPDNGAKVILVVPRNRDVEVIGCDYWCEVVYEGTRGYIYKSFVRRTDS